MSIKTIKDNSTAAKIFPFLLPVPLLFSAGLVLISAIYALVYSQPAYEVAEMPSQHFYVSFWVPLVAGLLLLADVIQNRYIEKDNKLKPIFDIGVAGCFFVLTLVSIVMYYRTYSDTAPLAAGPRILAVILLLFYSGINIALRVMLFKKPDYLKSSQNRNYLIYISLSISLLVLILSTISIGVYHTIIAGQYTIDLIVLYIIFVASLAVSALNFYGLASKKLPFNKLASYNFYSSIVLVILSILGVLTSLFLRIGSSITNQNLHLFFWSGIGGIACLIATSLVAIYFGFSNFKEN